MIETLQTIVDQIRDGLLEYDPHGFVLVLMSESNPDHCEVLNVGIPGTGEMDRCANAIHRRAEAARGLARELAANARQDDSASPAISIPPR
jgi:hypothetical protein